MRKWNYITFLILLVPHMQAQVEKVTKLLKDIDEFYKKLDCPKGFLKPIVVDINEVERNPIPNLDFATHVNAYARYQLLNTLLYDPVLAKRCGNMSSSKEQLVWSRTIGLTDIWRYKLCFILRYRCTIDRPSRLIPVIIDIEDVHKDQTHVVQNPSIIPAPDQTYATCTPLDQHILLPNGKVERRQQWKCVFPNQTSIIVPMQVLENSPKPPGPSPSPPGQSPSPPGQTPSPPEQSPSPPGQSPSPPGQSPSPPEQSPSPPGQSPSPPEQSPSPPGPSPSPPEQSPSPPEQSPSPPGPSPSPPGQSPSPPGPSPSPPEQSPSPPGQSPSPERQINHPNGQPLISINQKANVEVDGVKFTA